MQPQMKHTNTATAPKHNFAARDDDTRLLPPHPKRGVAPPSPCLTHSPSGQWETRNT